MFELISDAESGVAGERIALRFRYTHERLPLERGASPRVGYNLQDGAGKAQTSDLVYHAFLNTGDTAELAWEDPHFAPSDNCHIRITQLDGETA